MNYIEIKDCPSNVIASNKYQSDQYPEIGIYRSPDNTGELIIVDNINAGVIALSVYFNVDLLIKSNNPDVAQFEVGEIMATESVSVESMLKAIAVAQKPELAFK